MKEFQIGKLVRDNIIDTITKNGGEVVFHRLTGKELAEAATKKLLEEARELQEAGDNIASELADMQELINLVSELSGISKDELEEVMAKKREKAGAFDEGFYIERLALPDDSEWIEHYTQRSEKFPEIKRTPSEKLNEIENE